MIIAENRPKPVSIKGCRPDLNQSRTRIADLLSLEGNVEASPKIAIAPSMPVWHPRHLVARI